METGLHTYLAQRVGRIIIKSFYGVCAFGAAPPSIASAKDLVGPKIKPPKQMRIPRIGVFSFSFLIGVAACLASPPKVIIDTDFNTISDDGQVAVMAAQLYAQGTIDLLGFTILLF